MKKSPSQKGYWKGYFFALEIITHEHDKRNYPFLEEESQLSLGL